MGMVLARRFFTFGLQKQWEADGGGLLAEYKIEGIDQEI